MMGYQTGFQPKLFYHQINLDQRVPQNHILGLVYVVYGDVVYYFTIFDFCCIRKKCRGLLV
jgi:hypothetical protein